MKSREERKARRKRWWLVIKGFFVNNGADIAREVAEAVKRRRRK